MALAQIIGTGSYAPEQVITNKDLEKFVDTSDEWITERTGIKQRRKAAPGEATSDMAVAAARKALEMAGTRPEQVDLIVVGTITPDMPMPSCAAFVQAKLGAVNAFAFDVAAACAGSIYALSVAEQFIQTGKVKRALVIGADLFTQLVNWGDRNTCVLFGDGAGAMLLAPAEEPERGILSTHLRMDGSLAEILAIPGGGSKEPLTEENLRAQRNKVVMNGREVFKCAVRALADITQEALSANGLTASQVDHVIVHQANSRILESVMQRLEVPLEKCWINLDKYGNTSAASLPISLDEALRSGRIKRGDLVAMMAIGAGMTWGAAMVRW
ncbi:MAG TPA: beta-ketoacyl-ACP synthase III [Myxococcaceae bacterium]|nr:beta-ketoacyl-ACP synthase III [Myxococcaceae bacterium]